VHVYVDDKQCYSGDLEDACGSLVSLTDEICSELPPEMKELLETAPHRGTKRILDPDGEIFPLYEFRRLEFQILSTYSNPQMFGLSMIRMYDVDGDLVEIDPERAVFETHDCATGTDVSTVFAKKLGDVGDSFIPWRGSFTDGTPKIAVRFEEPVRAIALEIVNADITHTDEDISVKGIHILADNKSLWVGKLNHRTGTSPDWKPNSTFVFTICSREANRLVLGDTRKK
jgi:hypothetical protein